MSLSDDKQADVIDAFNTTSRYLDDILNINNVYFDNMVSQIYPSELQLNKANASDTEAAFLDLHLSNSNDIVSTKIYDERDDFDFEIVNFPFLDGDVPRSTSYGVYISQLIRFARTSSYVADFNTRNKLLTQKLLKQGYRYHKLRKTFSKFYRRYYDLISKFQVGLKSLLCQGATLLSSLIARRWVGLQTLWWFRLKDLSIDEMVGAWCFGCLSGPPGLPVGFLLLRYSV